MSSRIEQIIEEIEEYIDSCKFQQIGRASCRERVYVLV